jgi:signal transduction histidine kinase
MTKKLLFHLIFACGLLITALIYDFGFSTKTNLKNYADLINNHLHTQEEEVEIFFNNKAFINRQLHESSNEDIITQEQDFSLLKQLSEKDYSITIHKNDSLIFWTNNIILPESSDLSTIGSERYHEFKKLSNGYYELIGQSYKDSDFGKYVVTALIPIQYQFDIESAYLKDNFKVGEEIPSNIIITQNGKYPIVSKSGKTLCYLENAGAIIDTKTLQNSLWLYLLALMSIISLFHKIAQNLIQRRLIWQGAAFFIITVFGLRLVTYFIGFNTKFEALSLFTKNFDTNLSSSLGDLLINIGLLFWVMAFFHSEFPVRPSNHLSPGTKFRVTALNYLAIFGGILMLTSVFKTLVFSTSLNFDLDNVFDLDLNSVFAVTGLILLLIALFLFSHRMMMTIKKIGLNRNKRLLAIGLAALVCSPFLIYIDFIISPVYLMFLAFFFVLVFDIFIDNNSPNFTWLLIWLVILAAFPSILLFRYNGFKDSLIRKAYAKELTDPKDLIVENSLDKLKTKILSDSLLKSGLTSPPFEIDEASLRKKIDPLFITDNYLFYNYTYKVSGFNKFNEAIIKGQEIEKENIELKLESSERTPTKDVKYWSNDLGKSSYLLDVYLPANDNTDHTVLLVLEFQRQRREQSKVYTELLNDRPYKNLDKLSKYDYAVYKNNRRIDYEGKTYGISLTIPNLPEEGFFKEEMVGNRSELIYNAPGNTVVIIGKETEDHLKKAISLFSYIFSILLIFVLIFAVANYFKKILPESVNFFLTKKPSLRNRIQFSVIGMILISFLFIGVVTVWFFNNSSHDYHVKRLERKTSSIQGAALHKMSFLLKDSINDFIPSKENLAKLNIVTPMSKVHRMDVNLFDLKGELAASSEEDIFNKGIVSRQMSSVAFKALRNQGINSYTQDKVLMGSLVYQTAYVPLKIKDKTIAYLGLPYYTETKNLRSDVTVFMSTLLNVYVFLLLIAGGLAIFVANSITKPIAEIGDKLKKLKLGIRNQPLEWQSQDEIGTLIGEYNKMIHKLEDSADRLAQSERESAWREMAKQVAHEIKNPLTPMKLSIQYLQHAFRSNPENIEPLLKRVSNTLIEQIDNLAQIASEFGNFAKMPRAENQNLDFNNLVLSVYDLFHDGESDLDISLNLPTEVYTVYADKNHLIRVLNNLVKNAQQAIPDDRKGRIEISVYTKKEKVVLKVSDNGSGIPDDKKEKVFVPNFTTKSSGTGLGLAISKNIIESVNGEIYFKTEVGQGTDFFVELPIILINESEPLLKATTE